VSETSEGRGFEPRSRHHHTHLMPKAKIGKLFATY